MMDDRRLLLILSMIIAPAVAQEGGFGGGFGGEPKFCAPYRCPKGQEPVPKWPLRLTSTGCSGIGGMQMFSPGDRGGGEDPQTPCCDMRSACLQTCGTVKSHCDEEFLKCTRATCAALPTTAEQDECNKSAGIHDLMVKMDQCQRYDSEQYSHCECVKKKDAPAKREQVLRAFYKKFNPEGVDKVPALAQKADNSRKMAGLLMKLYKKYPQVIKKKKDPQQEMMERMMKEAKYKDQDAGGETAAAPEEEEEESNAEDLGTDEL